MVDKSEFKQTEINRIPEGWERLRLGDVCQKIGSGATPRGGNGVYLPQGISLIRSQNVYNNRFEHDGLAFIRDGHAEQLKNVIVEKDDVLLNITGDSVARVSQVPDEILPARVNQHVAIIRPRKDILNPQYLKYYLVSSSMQDHMLGLAAAGATRKALTKGMIESFQIPAPLIDEQQNIAQILGTLDAKIDLNRRMNETLEHIARAIFKKWFVDDADLKWTKGKVKDICDKITKGTTPTTLNRKFVKAGINFIKAESIDNFGNLLKEKFACIDNDTNLSLSRSILQENDILYTIAGTIGRTAVVNSDHLPANTNQAVAILRLKNKSLHLSYVRLLLKTSNISENFKRRVVQAVQANLSLGEISETEIFIPDEQILKEFNKIADSIFLKINENSRQINTLSQIRDTLLPKLMSGEIRVKC